MTNNGFEPFLFPGGSFGMPPVWFPAQHQESQDTQRLLFLWRDELAPGIADALVEWYRKVRPELIAPAWDEVGDITPQPQAIIEVFARSTATQEVAIEIARLIHRRWGTSPELDLIIQLIESSTVRYTSVGMAIDRIAGSIHAADGTSRKACRIAVYLVLFIGGWLPALTDGQHNVEDYSVPVVLVATELQKRLEKDSEDDSKDRDPHRQKRSRKKGGRHRRDNK